MAEQGSAMPVTSESSSSESRVVTFYSYKGGVGRSMALANIAVLLAQDHGKQVIVVDWDLEAPGLHKFFGIGDEDIDQGVIEYLYNYKNLVRDPRPNLDIRDISVKKYLKDVRRFSSGGSIRLLPAGSQKDRAKYAEKVRAFDWENFYRDWNGAQVIEALRTEFKTLSGFTLIDSRTGVTDVGGICTMQLPDTVVFVFVFNDQNLSGVEQVASELTNAESSAVKALHRRPDMLFLPSRKELTELPRLRDWEGKSAERLRRFCNTPIILKRYNDPRTYLRKMSIPYVPYFAYGEELAALSEKGYEMTEAFEPLLSLLLREDRERLPETKQDIAEKQSTLIGATATIILLLGAIYLYLIFVSDNLNTKIISSTSTWLAGCGGVLGSLIVSFAPIASARSNRKVLSERMSFLIAKLAISASLGACVAALPGILKYHGQFEPILYVLAGGVVAYSLRTGIERYASIFSKLVDRT